MLHPAVAEHVVSGSAPRAILSRTVGKFVEGLPEKLGTSESPMDSTRLTALSRHRSDSTERRHALGILPAVSLRAKRAEQAWRQRVAGTTQIREEVRVGMAVHGFGDLGIELLDRLLGLLYLIGQ